MASKENNWNLPFADIASIWRDGCIIRSRFLQKITDAYNRDADLANLLLDEYFLDVTAKYQQAVRDIVALAVQAGVPVPTFSAAITYFDSYRSADLPANLIQAQRDYFGAHTYQRKDKEGTFHYSWYDEKISRSAMGKRILLLEKERNLAHFLSLELQKSNTVLIW